MNNDELERRRNYNYALKCLSCGNSFFSATPDGFIICDECGVTYSYIHGVKNWIPISYDPEEYMEEILGLKWDPKKQKFTDINKDEKGENKW